MVALRDVAHQNKNKKALFKRIKFGRLFFKLVNPLKIVLIKIDLLPFKIRFVRLRYFSVTKAKM